jgi:uncharacterized protein (DUF2336 family)
MSAAASLIPELEQVLQHGSPERCAEMLAGITDLFLSRAERYNAEHLELFDAVFARLVEEIETRARAALSLKIAPVANAPPRLVRRLANDDDIAVAAPVLQQSPRLSDADLRAIAGSKGQGHLLAISARSQLAESVTDVLIERGNREVIRTVADNRRARLSERGFTSLVERAAGDEELAEKVGHRPDIPPRLYRALLLQATEVVRQRLLANAKPETAAEIRRVLAQVSADLRARAPQPRDYARAKAAIFALKEQGRLDEATLRELAEKRRFEDTVAALAEMTQVPIETVERLMSGERADPVLILCKAAGFGWPTARAVILVRAAAAPSHQALEEAQANFERLSPATALRVTRFWQLRHSA